MALRTDSNRFADINYVRSLLQTYFRINVGPLSPAQQKQLDEEMRQFNEYYKGVLDILTNLAAYGVSVHNVCVYFELVQKTGGSRGAISQIMRYTFQFTKEAQLGAGFIKTVAENSSNISKTLGKLNTGGARFLGFLVCIQVAIHASRGDYAKCVGEIAKTALSGAIPLMAFMDLVDSIIGLIVPDWVLKQPVVRVLRGMNPAQCTNYIVENMCWLVYCGTVARTKGWGAFNKALDAWCVQMEKSPMAIYTNLAADTAVLLDSILPNCMSNFSVFGASIRNLADYTRANPTSY